MTFTHSFRTSGLAAALALTLAPATLAGDFTGLDANANLYDVDTTTSTATNLGPIAGAPFFGFGPIERAPDGTLYALEGSPFGGAAFTIHTIDEGTMTITNSVAAVGPSSPGNVGFAIDSAGKGWVFGTIALSFNGFLDEVDLVTGAVTPRGGIGGNTWGLSFDSAGNLYTTIQGAMFPDLILVNQVDASASTNLGPLTGVDFNFGVELTSDRGSGSMHVLSRATEQIYSIDPATPSATLVSTITGGDDIQRLVEAFEDPFEVFCNADGTGMPAGCGACPCGNDAPAGTVGGCINSNTTSASLDPSGDPTVGSDTLRFQVTGASPSSFGILQSADNQLPNGMGMCATGSGILSPVLDGLRCVGGMAQRHGTRATDANGDIGITTPGWGPPNGPVGGLIAQGGFIVGQTRHYQCFYREDVLAGCLTGQNTTNAVSVTYQ